MFFKTFEKRVKPKEKQYLTSLGNKMKKIIILLLITLIELPFLSCDTTETGNNEQLYIELADVSCTESWLKVETSGVNFPAELKLYRDNELNQEIMLTENSTTVYDSLLASSQGYLYQVELAGITSKEITVTTLDTTSHNFSCETFTFGEHASSYLNDVVIIDENNIIAVGQIFLNDSLGNADPRSYSVAKWGGEKWELKKLFYNTNSIVAPIRGILVLNTNDIYLAAGSIFHWDGVSSSVQLVYSRLDLPGSSATIEKLWGESNSFLYGVGNGGSIVHYNGSTWQKIESGTNLEIQDIWGAYDEETEDYEIMCIASDKYYGGGPELFMIKNNNVLPQPIEGLSWSISSIWFKNKYKTYVVGGGIFVKSVGSKGKEWQNITEGVTTYYTHSIRGNNLNDIFISGSGGELVHFNGSTWQNYRDNGVLSFYGNYNSVSIKGNIICAVGEAALDKNKAIIALGFR